MNKFFSRRLCNLFTVLPALFLFPSTAKAVDVDVHTVEYKNVGEVALLLDVCVPTTGVQDAVPERRPVVIVVHGGGWGSGNRKTMIEPILESLINGGYIYVSIDYRLSPAHRWPACREDVEDAVKWTAANVQQYGGDPDRIAILGYSAGGQLAFWAAITDGSARTIKALVGLAPATDFLEDLGRRGGPSKALRDLMDCTDDEPLGSTLLRLYEASPINYLHADLPPILLIHGTEDLSVPLQQSIHIQQKIRQNKWDVPCEIHEVEGAPHRQSEWDEFDDGYKGKLLEWLDERL